MMDLYCARVLKRNTIQLPREKQGGKKSLLAAKTAIVDGERPGAMRRTGEANKKVNISLI